MAEEKQTVKIISKTVLALSFVSLFADVASEMLYPVVPVYLQSIGFSFFLIGLLEGVAECTAGLSKGSFGQWSDRLGRRVPFIQWGYGLSAISKPMMALFIAPWWIFLARVIDRLGKGLRTAPRDAILALESTPQTKARVFGFHRSMDTIGAVVGPSIALVVLHFWPESLRSMFLFAFVPGAISVVLTLRLRDASKARKDANVDSSQSTKPPGFLSYFSYWNQATPNYRRVLAGLTLFALINSSDMFLLLRVKDISASVQIPVLVYILYNIVYASAAYPLAKLADRFGVSRVVVAGLVLFAICYAAMSKVATAEECIAVFVLYGFSMAAIESNAKAWLCGYAHKETMGTAVGLYVSTQSLALLCASSLTGLLWSVIGAERTFQLSAVGAVLSAVLLVSFMLMSRRENQLRT